MKKNNIYFGLLMTLVLFVSPILVSAQEVIVDNNALDELTNVVEDATSEIENETVDEVEESIETTDLDVTADEEEIGSEEETVYVAKIGEVNYATLDEAISAAVSGDKIVLLSDATTAGINLNKDLYIASEEEKEYTITFTTYGIAMWGKTLSFKNVNIVMNSIKSTPYTAEWNWMTICGSNGSNLLLDNVDMTLDGVNTDNKHAIYFTGNNKFELINGSNLIIRNYTQDAVEWDGGEPSTYSFLVKDSTFLAENNRSGIAGTFTAKFDNAKVDVINNKGNGSNGTHFEIVNKSVVNFSDNGTHGLSAGRLIIDDSTVTANRNGGNGIHTTAIFTVRNNSIVEVKENKCGTASKWTRPGAVYVGGKDSSVTADSTFTVVGNLGSGIYVKNTGSLVIETGTITNNHATTLDGDSGYGGGIYNAGVVVVKDGVELYNNTADKAADDVYNVAGATITLPKTGEDWALDGGVKHDDLEDCTDDINGWYDDNNNVVEDLEDDTRWEAHGETEEDDYYVEVEPVTESTEELKIKAAHDKAKVIVRYVDNLGTALTDDITLIGISGNEYVTEEKAFEGYTLVEVEGETEGLFEKETIIVTYIYSVEEMGDEVPPHTGVEVSVSYANYNNVLYSEKKRNNKKVNF